jgi:hypothetical protein
MDRFWSKVDRSQGPAGCWLWLRKPNKAGRPIFQIGGRSVYAYRVAYELLIAPLSDSAHLHHKCENPMCVNPAHLVVTDIVGHRHLHRWTHCHRGHPLSGANLYVSRTGRRLCRACGALRYQMYRSRKVG